MNAPTHLWTTRLAGTLAAIRLLVLVTCHVAMVPAARCGEPFRFPEGRYEQAQLTYRNELPVLVVAGTPREIGEQQAVLLRAGARELLGYPKTLLKGFGVENRWPALVKAANSLLPQFPPHHRQELEAFAAKAPVDRELLIAANTLVDCYHGGLGCSSLLVDPAKSKSDGPLFGRNLDYYSQGILHKYSLVTIFRPAGKHAFASIGFPGMFGCLSGMNDAGLALATHEVFFSRDGAPLFNPQGTPYMLLFRRILEECTTVEEAVALLRGVQRTTLFNLALCDRAGGAVAEATPRNVVLRRGQDGITACVNHFRSDELGAAIRFSGRYNTLIRARFLDKLDVADVAARLEEAGSRSLTIQTMIFEPATLRLHLAIGASPTSNQPLKPLDLGPLLRPSVDGASTQSSSSR